MLGYRQADLLAMTCRGLTHPDDYPATERAIKSLLAGETATVSMEKRYIRGDGSHLWGALTMSAVRGASGAPHYMTAVVEDISQRKLAETAMRESEALFRTLFEGAPLPNYLVDPVSASIVDCNEAAARMLGYERGVLRRMKVEDIDASMLPGGDLPFRQPMLEGQPIQVETRHRMRSGGLRDVVIAVVPVDIGGRRLVHGTVVDITDLRRLTSELEALVRDEVAAREAAQARAAQAERLQALGQLAGGIAHDFNNVLQAVQGSASMVARHAGDPAAAGRYARIALDAAARGAGITRRLLAFARRGDLHAEPFAPAAILESMRHMLAPTLGSAITVRVEADACLPAILADRGHLETVLVNLAANARDAMPLGGTLSLSAAAVDVADGAVHPAHLAPGSYVRIAVTDTGDGMDAATLAQAFQPFFTTKPKGQGTGLGLAMAKGFAEQSGGGAAISSEPGKGTAVTIWLPAPVAWTPAPPGGEDAGGTAESGVRAARILVVDDDALVLETVAAQLEDEGFGVTTAADGMQALALLDGGLAVDALVSDLSMPGMDGVNLILEAQARRPGMPAVLLTGYAGDAVMLALGRRIEGPFALMRKPSQGQMLADQLLALLVKADKPVA
jgi:PAS domain S-box-containing protein